MFRPRVIPILLLKNNGLVKSIKFKNYRYIGDPINAVKIFNDLRADELVFLDILATREKKTISLDFVRRVGNEANMPFSVGGGIRTIKQISDIIKAGAEKVVINSYAYEKPNFIKEAADEFGSSTVVVSIDVNKKFLSKKQVYTLCGSKATGIDPVTFAKLMEDKGAGEIIINSIEKDGMMTGYDFDLVKRVSKSVTIPVIAAGGVGSFKDFRLAINKFYASAVSAGSIFVYHGPRKAVLINYPNSKELIKIFQNEDSGRT